MISLLVSDFKKISKARDSNLDERFEQYRKDYGKQYTEEEIESRREIFDGNLKEIEEHNKRSTSIYTKGVTQFADLTKEEFVAAIRGMLKSDLHVHMGL